MSRIFFFRSIKHACAILITSVSLVGHTFGADVVTADKDEYGWKLKVNGSDFYVKGVVWGYMPRNENYNYSLFNQSDDFIRKVLDYEFGLMKAAGVNAIRTFGVAPPPKWVTYIYREYGIMTVVNPLVGRYGATIGGKWVEFTDYSDELTRLTLKKETLDVVNRYKNVDGVLMFALGNESNYGLSWKSFEIENLPVGEQNTAKARYLYSLFNEIMAAGQRMDQNHPFTIVNGDLQYIDLIDEICTDMDLLGVNAYRGKSFTGLWDEVDKKLDVPVVFFEFGSDAFNARTFEEDQLNQALIIKEQWREMYNKAAGNGEEGNSIGGFQFEWRDEWWKYLQEERLDIHDTNASWANGGYPHDFVEGQNNMNEEWWGITALGDVNSEGIYEARPRMAYDVLSEIWTVDPYTYKKAAINERIADINMEYQELKAEVRQLKSESKERKKFELTGGSLSLEYADLSDKASLDEFGNTDDEWTNGEMVFLDFGFAPTKDIEGQFTVNVLGNVADLGPQQIQYGRRGLDIDVQSFADFDGDDQGEVPFRATLDDRERVEIYDFGAKYSGKYVDIEAFYHTPRYHWKYEGDFFGLVNEATDIDGSDIWNSKAPEGIEFASKGATEEEGLKFVIGPEIYWGANPKAVIKYSSYLGKTMPFLGDGLFGKTQYTAMLSYDFDRKDDDAVGGTAATVRKSKAGTIYTKTSFTDDLSLELGGIVSAWERIDESYTRLKGDDIIRDEIDSEDTLGFRAKLNFPLFGSLAYVSTAYAGLVAKGGDQLTEFGTKLPYSGLGNKRVYEGGVLIPLGNWWIFPRYFKRTNLVDANPNIAPEISGGILNPGLSPRNEDDDPFAVLDNREVKAAELMVTYDPTGATPFYQWDNDWREDAKFAFNVGANYHRFTSATDSYQFFFEPTGENPAFGVGLPREDVWVLSNRTVLNPNTSWRIITNVERSFLQSTGDPDGGTRKYWDIDGKVVYNDRHIVSGYFKKDAWGPYDFQRQFNITYPEQYKLEYKFLLDQKKSESTSSNIGGYILYRNIDAESGLSELLTDDDYQSQIVLFYELNFGGTNRPRRIN